MTKKPSQKEIDKICAVYDSCDENGREAARKLKISPAKVYCAWKEKNLQAKGTRGIPFSKEDKRGIVYSYKYFGGHASNASEALGYDPVTIAKYWEKAGLEVVGGGLTQKQKQKVPGLYREYEGSREKVANEFGCSTLMISKTLKEFGIEPLECYRGHLNVLEYFETHKEKYGKMGRGELAIADNGLYTTLLKSGNLDEAIPKKKVDKPSPSEEKIKRFKEKIEEISNLYKELQEVSLVAKELNFSSVTVRKYLKLKGIKLKKGRKPLQKKHKFSEDKKTLLEKLYEVSGNLSLVARAIEVPPHTVRNYVKKNKLGKYANLPDD